MANQKLLIRDTMKDVGTVPSQGNVWQSPDIIPNGEILNAEWEEYFKGNYETYTASDYKPVEFGSTNNVFVRVKNISQTTQTFTVRLYYSNVTSLLLEPDTWKSNEITELVKGASSSITLAAGAIGVTGFKWKPTSDKNKHHCLIATAGLDTSSIPSKLKNQDFSSWVRNHSEIGWRNVRIVDQLPDNHLKDVFEIENGDDSEESFVIRMDTYNAPNGTIISFQSCQANGTPISDGVVTKKSKSTSKSHDKLFESVSLSANYQGYVLSQVQPPDGQTVPNDFSVIFTYYWLPLFGEFDEALTVPLESLEIDPELAKKAITALQMGSASTDMEKK